ncbi:TPA: hypothetical protein I7682_17980 [Vibrio vulnificus]|nr:hypothetical protein [Vibrio vulnificus]
MANLKWIGLTLVSFTANSYPLELTVFSLDPRGDSYSSYLFSLPITQDIQTSPGKIFHVSEMSYGKVNFAHSVLRKNGEVVTVGAPQHIYDQIEVFRSADNEFGIEWRITGRREITKGQVSYFSPSSWRGRINWSGKGEKECVRSDWQYYGTEAYEVCIRTLDEYSNF